MLKFGHLDENNFLAQKLDFFCPAGSKTAVSNRSFDLSYVSEIERFSNDFLCKRKLTFHKFQKSTFSQHLGNICCLNVALKAALCHKKSKEKRLFSDI